MPTGEYSVAKGKPRGKIRNSDNSFISCMFAIFLFILLCVILILIMLAVKWKRADDELEMDEAYSDKSRRTSTNLTTTTTTTTISTPTTTVRKSMRIENENSTTSIQPTTSPRVTFESSSGTSTPETERAPLSPDGGGTTSGETESTDKSAPKVGVEDREETTTEVTTTLSTDHKDSTSSMPSETDVPVTSHIATTEMESTSDSSVEERRGSTEVTSLTDKTLPFSASNTDVTPTMIETTTSTETSTAVPGSLSTFVTTSSEGDTTVTSSSKGDTTVTTSREGDTTVTSSSEGETTVTSLIGGDTTVTSLSEGDTTVASSKADTTVTSSEGETTVTSLSEGDTTVASSKADTTVTSSSEGDTTVTSSSKGETTVTSSSEGETTVTSLIGGDTTVTSSSKGDTTVTSSSKGDTTVTSLSEGETTVTSSSKGDTTVTSSSEVETTVTSSSKGETTVTSSSEVDTTVTSLSEGDTTVTSSSKGDTTATSLSEVDTTVTSLSEGDTTVTSSSEGDTTVPTGPEVYPTTNTNETTSDIPTTSVVFTETTTGSATSTPLVFTEMTVTSPTEPPVSMTTISSKTVNGTCDKLECKRLAGRMLAQMGHEFNPCDNFYMYACGGIHSDPFLQPYDYTIEVTKRIQYGMEEGSRHNQTAFLKFANFYKSCKDAGDLEDQLAKEILKILGEIGDFHDPDKGKDVNFTHFFAEIISLHRPLLFDIIVDVDESNSDHYMLKMTTPIHENPFQYGSHVPVECYSDIENNSNLNEEYERIRSCKLESKIRSLPKGIEEMFVIPKRTYNYTIHRYHYEAVNDSVDLMGMVYKMEPSESERTNYLLTKKYKLVTVSELNKNYPVINWTVLLEKLLGKSLPDNTTVQLYFAEYFNKLFGKFKEDNFTKIYNGLLAAFVHQMYEDLVENKSFDEDYCLTVAAKLMVEVATGAYLNSFNREELDAKRKSVETIFTQLQETFKQLLHSSDWLGSDKDALIKKLDSMTLAADGGVDFFTMEKLNSQMNDFDISEEPDNYVRNSIVLLRRYRSNIYKSLGGNPRNPENIWTHFSLPQDTYGISVYGINTVVMPYAKLAWPFFHMDYPEFLQIAGLGHIIAHEMSHHFDNVGLKYSPKGERATMLHDRAQVSYTKMETCFEKQFNKTETQQSEDGKTFTFTLSAELHREEQLADDIATPLLYSLFKNRNDLYAEKVPFLGMNNDQVFFLHLAQAFCTKDTLQSNIETLFENKHLPSLLRVNHFVSQSKDFSDVFNCPADSKMNPVHRCDVFPALNSVPVTL